MEPRRCQRGELAGLRLKKNCTRHSNFARRAFRLSADVNARFADPKMRLDAIKTVLKIHGLCHSRKPG
ncbi:hypothetical protein [Amycolatopsis sp. NPDC054798]